MAKKHDTKKKIVIGTAAAVVAGGAAAMAHPKVRKEAGKLGRGAMNKAKEIKEDIEDKF